MINTHRCSTLMALFLPLLVLSACASLNKKECLSGDWTTIGRLDSTKGKVAIEQLAAHAKACGKHGVQLDETVYMSGYKEGLETYCTNENGYRIGSDFAKSSFRDTSYRGICPKDLELDYLTGYINGMKVNLDILHEELSEEETDRDGKAGALLLLTVLNSSRAESMEEDLEEADDSISDKKSRQTKTIKEIEKWLLAYPELRDLLN